jgi:hypothetical protein
MIILVVYIALSKFGLINGFKIFMALGFIDLVIRFFIGIAFYFSEKFGITRNFILSRNRRLNETFDS